MLQGWLEEDLPALATLQSVKRASRDWAANGGDAAWLTHSGERLKAAERLADRPDLAGNLEPTDESYLTACRNAARAAAARSRRVQAIAAALLVLLALGGWGWLYQDTLRERGYWFAFMRPQVLTKAQERALKPGDTFAECENDCPKMVVVPPGTFLMGSDPSVGEDNEHPQHEVTIPKPFAAGMHETTFAEWGACVDSGACPEAADNGWGRGSQPVINVSWNDTQRYVSWLKRVTGKPYRLLTEAEWEYAARAGSTALYSFGDSEALLDEYAWHAGNAQMKTHAVGERKANIFQLADMHGNVWEWVQDCMHDSYEGAPADGSAWLTGTTGKECDLRMHRGGSWANAPAYLRSAKRVKGPKGLAGISLGFRVARTLDQ